MDVSLFQGTNIYLAAHDPESDAEIESRWTHDLDFMHAISTRPALPLPTAQIKKKYKEAEKGDRNRFSFAIHTLQDQRLIGFVRLHHIEWPNQFGWIKIGIGDKADRGRGYGKEALNLALNYAFCELNLYRISATAAEYNVSWLGLLKNTGFVEEVHQREALHVNGRWFDNLILGLLKEEWIPGGGKEHLSHG
jgi:RimJ/RimL family protein N-acetyltransferase